MNPASQFVTRLRRWSVAAVAAAVLIVAIMRQAAAPREASTSIPQTSALAAPVLPGWSCRTMPLAANPEQHLRTVRALGFAAYTFQEFRRDERWVSIYAAHWPTGYKEPHLVSSHTPDQCWTAAGWTCVATGSAERALAMEVDGWLPGAWREFRTPEGRRIHVLFWHVVGTTAYTASSGSLARIAHLGWWARAAIGDGRCREPQYFVRIATNFSPAELARDSAWPHLAAALAEWGVISSPAR